MSKLLLIDGNSIMNRGYFALPKTLTAASGVHTNAILGFLNIFFKVYEEEQPTHVAVAFDVHEPTFRHKMYAEYKGTRHAMDPELREQFPLIKDILTKMNITYIEKGGYEADDIIGTMSRVGISSDMDVTVMSGDRDLLQLATDKVLIRIPKTKAGQTTVENYYADDVVKEYGVTPLEFIEMKGLMGDTSDNIPGVQGIGPKTASNIIQKYHTIEAALQDIDNVKPDKARKNLDEMRDMAIFSRELATIKLDCELDQSINDTEVSKSDIFSKDVYDCLSKLGLKSLLNRFELTTQEKLADKPELITKEADYNEIISLINKGTSYIGFFPVVIDGSIYGGAVYYDGTVYIIRDSSIKNIRKDINKDTVISMISIKEYISGLGLVSDDKMFDCSVAMYLLDPLAGGYSYSYMAYRLMEMDLPDEKTLLGKKEITIFSFDDPEYASYISYNAFVAGNVMDKLKKDLQEKAELSLYNDIEYPTIYALEAMERYGIGVNRDALVQYGDELEQRINQLSAKIIDYAGENFNINSTKQLGTILFEKLQLKSGKKTKSGYSTNVDVLNKIRNEHPIVPAILEYRSLTKLKSTYIDGLLGSIKGDGRIHSKFNQTVTATGRLSSTEPNLQNIPARTAEGREIRKAFVPAPGFTFVDADYSQIELRVMASISGDEALIDAFNQSKDIHAITASQVFGVELENVTPELRRKAKAVNFGIIYGISSFGLGEDLGISRSEAKEYIEKYFETYSQVKNYLDERVQEAKTEGTVRTMFGRIRPIPELSSSNFMQRSFGERIAMNSPIQGTAADIIKLAMVNVDKEIKEKGLKSRLILQIHDELLIETALDEVEIVKQLLTDNMENAVKMAVPLYVDVHTGDSLYDAK